MWTWGFWNLIARLRILNFSVSAWMPTNNTITCSWSETWYRTWESSHLYSCVVISLIFFSCVKMHKVTLECKEKKVCFLREPNREIHSSKGQMKPCGPESDSFLQNWRIPQIFWGFNKRDNLGWWDIFVPASIAIQEALTCHYQLDSYRGHVSWWSSKQRVEMTERYAWFGPFTCSNMSESVISDWNNHLTWSI